MTKKIIKIIQNMNLAKFYELEQQESEELYASTEAIADKPIKKWKKVEIESWIGYWYNINFGIEYNKNPAANHLNYNNTDKTYTEWLNDNENKLIATCGYKPDSLLYITQVVNFIDNSKAPFNKEVFFLVKLIEIFGLDGLMCLGI